MASCTHIILIDHNPLNLVFYVIKGSSKIALADGDSTPTEFDIGGLELINNARPSNVDIDDTHQDSDETVRYYDTLESTI